jgi:hypothetical protein
VHVYVLLLRDPGIAISMGKKVKESLETQLAYYKDMDMWHPHGKPHVTSKKESYICFDISYMRRQCGRAHE